MYPFFTYLNLKNHSCFGSIMPGRSYTAIGAGNYRYGFNGKEADNEINVDGGSYDFGARIYDGRLGRWLSLDPLSKKYPELSPYSYCASNPIFFIDPDGNIIVVPHVADRSEVLKMINSKALGTFAFDKAGKLYQVKADGDATKYSTYYRDKLVAAIAEPETISIIIKNNIKKPDVAADGKTLVEEGSNIPVNVDARWGGGVTYSVQGGDAMSYVSGNENTTLKDTNGNPLPDKPADILAHELVGHSIPKILGTDTGNAIENENKVRTEVKTNPSTPSPLRAADPGHVE